MRVVLWPGGIGGTLHVVTDPPHHETHFMSSDTVAGPASLSFVNVLLGTSLSNPLLSQGPGTFGRG